jgi:hypothetical protein
MTVPSGGYRVTVDELNAVIQHVDTTPGNDWDATTQGKADPVGNPTTGVVTVGRKDETGYFAYNVAGPKFKFGFSVVSPREHEAGEAYAQSINVSTPTSTTINYGVGGGARDYDSPQNTIQINPWLKIGAKESESAVEGVEVAHEVVLDDSTRRFVCRIRVRNTNNVAKTFSVAVFGDVIIAGGANREMIEMNGANIRLFSQAGAALFGHVGSDGTATIHQSGTIHPTTLSDTLTLEADGGVVVVDPPELLSRRRRRS